MHWLGADLICKCHLLRHDYLVSEASCETKPKAWNRDVIGAQCGHLHAIMVVLVVLQVGDREQTCLGQQPCIERYMLAQTFWCSNAVSPPTCCVFVYLVLQATQSNKNVQKLLSLEGSRLKTLQCLSANTFLH